MEPTPPATISATTLGAVLENPAERSKVVILDVRDSDFAGGNIRGAVNVPSEDFRARLPEISRRYGATETVVVHCMMSQVRGPTCAKMLKHQLEMDGCQARVMVLEGGFTSFQRTHRSHNPHLLENLDED